MDSSVEFVQTAIHSCVVSAGFVHRPAQALGELRIRTISASFCAEDLHRHCMPVTTSPTVREIRGSAVMPAARGLKAITVIITTVLANEAGMSKSEILRTRCPEAALYPVSRHQAAKSVALAPISAAFRGGFNLWFSEKQSARD